MLKPFTLKCSEENFIRFRDWAKKQKLSQNEAMEILLNNSNAPKIKKQKIDPNQITLF
jgi:hypothetical protein